MSKVNSISPLEIAAKIKAHKPFKVFTNRERKAVLTGAKFLGVRVVTSVNANGNPPFFDVLFP